ncbi:bifunctional diguanylate cyclase/phosphodiesterase [Thalassotalea euphylliae]|uniref:Phosphodiesterase n=1 Tax=Thalassotalea euphylliae TaxID=1655234 RepID=A0A3E0UF05_9GAMM|nr:GGDEF domain-containing phosphodiesterase [Thalassotalea euphylliae]REL35469.1 phosphodiesterase [Thalassotalea euphylliae]
MNEVVLSSRFPELLSDAIDPMLILRGEDVIDCNQAALDFFKFANRRECLTKRPWDLSPTYQPDGLLSLEKGWQKIMACYQHGKQRFLWLHRDMQQLLHWVEVTIVKISHGDSSYIHATIRDVVKTQSDNDSQSNEEEGTQLYQIDNGYREQLDLVNPYIQLLHEHKKVIDASSIVSKTSPKGIITYVNKNFCETSGYHERELIGQSHNIIRHPDMDAAVFKDLWRTIARGKIWQGVIKNRKKNGDTYLVKSTIAPIFNDSGRIAEYIAIRQDVTEFTKQKLVIEQQTIDPITKAKNYSTLLSDMSSELQCHIAIIDIPDLEVIQNAYDIKEYYRVFARVASQLASLLPVEATLYRHSGRSFAVLMPNTILFNDFIRFCLEWQNELEERDIETANNLFSLSFYIGLAQWMPDADLLSRARMALVGGDELNQKLSVFTQGSNIHSRLLSTIDWTNRLKSAVAGNGIVIFGQKIVNQQHDYYSTEVLMRYFDPDKQHYVSPIEFLGYAKRSKVYPSLSRVVIEKAFEYFASKQQRFSLNLSKADISDRFTANLILSLLDKYQLGKNVIIELVESENYELDDQKFADFLVKLKAHQCQIAIDDFGSGYSNFEYLTRLPVDIIKIDGSLIKQIATNQKHQVIVNTIVNFCHSLDIKVVAEYVANEQVLDKVKEFGVDMYQGYHFHQPERLH